MKLNGGKLRIPQNNKNHINLTTYQPNADEDALLQMGLNYHYEEKFDQKKKRLEIEILLDSIMSLQKKGEVTTSDSLKPLLLAESLTNRRRNCGSIMNKELRNAAKTLKQAEGITIRRADKTASLVLINTEEYHNKLDEILGDATKFKRIKKNPVDNIKRKANNIIEKVNACSNSIHLPLIHGDYEPGYIYGNVKTHKQGNPLKPIISQIPLPTYALAKALNNILSPYVPMKILYKFIIRIPRINKERP